MINHAIQLNDIKRAAQKLPSFIYKTPLIRSDSLSEKAQCEIFLKLENQQFTNSFKIRGASNAIGKLKSKNNHNAIVCVSTGNHGRGIAYAAKHYGFEAVIFMSSMVPDNKVNAISDLGAKVKITGDSQDDAELAAIDYCKNYNATYLPPFDHEDIIVGQGTIGIEIMAQLSTAKTVIVPVSGGGLISGIALAVKAINPDCDIIGVTMEKGAAMYESQQAGEPILVEELATIADALGGGIGLNNQYTFDIVKNYVNQLVLVSEEEIFSAIRHAYYKERQIIEGAGAVAIGAILSKKIKLTNPTVLILSGCNIDMKTHQSIINTS